MMPKLEMLRRRCMISKLKAIAYKNASAWSWILEARGIQTELNGAYAAGDAAM